MTQARIFKSNRSQAVRLPKEVALPEHVHKVEVYRLGHARLIVPEGQSWDDFFDGPGVSEDFMSDRIQPPTPEREAL